LSSQEVWVNVEEGAKITGYHLDHVRRLARENWRLPEAERLIRVRKDGHAYAIWLPDLVNYVERYVPVTASNGDHSQETWVNAAEGAKATGYNRQYMTRLAIKMAKKPDGEREIKL
jgi:hypothetical protein